MKIDFIYIILFFIFIISIFNLFYKPSIYNLFVLNKINSKFFEMPSILQSDEKLFCSITGYKCENEFCDCTTLCKGQYNKFTIYPNENIIMFNEKLAPGTYCLPKGFGQCNVKTSIPIFSVNGWLCFSKNRAIWNKDRFIACQNSFAVDNSLNRLIDKKTNNSVENEVIDDYYEIHNGEMRYQCSCDSLDMDGNKLIHLKDVPFKCVSDYCLKHLRFRRGIPGWNDSTKQCDCGHLEHEIPSNKSSPCVEQSFKLTNINFTGNVNCMTENSLTDFFIFCDKKNNKGQLSFKKIINFSNKPLDFLNKTV